MKIMKINNTLKTILFIVVVGIIGYAVKMIYKKSVSTAPDVSSILVTSANQINKNTPLQIDKYTILDNVAAIDHLFIYNFTITDNQTARYLINNTEEVKRNLINNFCTSKEMQVFRDHSIELFYKYKDKDYKEITSLTINRDQCKDAP